MAYDYELADRVRDVLAPRPDVSEKRMMGGLCFMIGDHMGCGIVGSALLVRVGRAAHAAVLAEPHVSPMAFTGRSMTGFVLVDADGVSTDRDLAAWVRRGVDFASSLPDKQA